MESRGSSVTKLVARQPILDRSQRVFGYELLYRPDAAVNACSDPKPEASLELIGDSLMLYELAALVDNHIAFINLTREDLLAGHARYLPKHLVAIEILESVPAEPEVLLVLQKLHRAGYTLALDDVTSPQRVDEFAGFIDIAKIDLTLTERPEQLTLVKAIRGLGIKALAEKVETKAQFRDLSEMGFEYFQGYFFARPEMVQRRDAPTGVWSQLRLLQALHQAEVDLAEVETAIQQDPGFAYKLLRYLNSPLFGFSTTIKSIRHAITLLGEREVRRWASIVALSSMPGRHSPELAQMAVRRALFCENLAGCGRLDAIGEKLFLAGLLSTLDGILDQPRAAIVKQLPLDREIAEALLKDDNQLGAALRLVEAYECADWERVAALGDKLGLSDAQLLSAYRSAINQSQQILRVATA